MADGRAPSRGILTTAHPADDCVLTLCNEIISAHYVRHRCVPGLFQRSAPYFASSAKKRKLNPGVDPWTERLLSALEAARALFPTGGFPLEEPFNTTEDDLNLEAMGAQFLPMARLNIPEIYEATRIPLDRSELLWHNLIETTSETEIVVGGIEFVLPPRSAFFMSDFEMISPFADLAGSFDCIVIDPPFDNKSVQRKKGYQFLHHTKLRQIPMNSLASPRGCLVAFWVTNNPVFQAFVEDLLSRWGAEILPTMCWMKVTTSLEPVVPFSNSERKSYEKIVLGVLHASDGASPLRTEPPSVIISVPGLHSQKPPLQDVLRTDVLLYLNTVSHP